MTDGAGQTPAERRRRIAAAILAHREAGTAAPVRFSATGDDAAPSDGDSVVAFADRTLTLPVDGDRRSRLDDVLASFPVFKIEQPATRKAPDGEVHVAALADAKHTADFVEALFRSVYDLPAEYELGVEEP
jgi:hypothetical protein